MNDTTLAVLITAIPSTLAGVAAVITALSNKKNNIESVKKDVKSIKEDVAVTKEASFYALQAHVENGVNGDVKKAHERIKGNVFGN